MPRPEPQEQPPGPQPRAPGPLLPGLGARWSRRISGDPLDVFLRLESDAPHVAWLEDSVDGVHVLAGAASASRPDLAGLRFDDRPSIGWVPYEAGMPQLGLAGDAATEWMRPERWVVFAEGLAELQSTGEPWELPDAPAEGDPRVTPTDVAGASRRPARALDDDDCYELRVRTCQEWIRRGDSYLACLTSGYTASGADPVATYLAMRQESPGHRGGFVRIGDRAIASITPERFLGVDGRSVWTEPIKGTRRRDPDAGVDAGLARELLESEKERAENVMIVDLCRNDLHLVCDAGTVGVRGLLRVESFAPVHQLVSTVTGRLRDGAETADAVRAMFPAGSMTGAPKRRTVELLQGLEGRPRGLYSGCFGVATKSFARLQMTIRAAVFDGSDAYVGVGGGITALSAAGEEVAEMRLKADAVLRSLRAAPQASTSATSSSSSSVQP